MLFKPCTNRQNGGRSREAAREKARQLRGMNTVVRKAYQGGQCYLLGEVIQETAHHYYYRRQHARVSFIVHKSPSIHTTPCMARPDWLASQEPQRQAVHKRLQSR